MELRPQVGVPAKWDGCGRKILASPDFHPKITGLYPAEHGGGCCGVTHLWDFPRLEATQEERVGWIRKVIEIKLGGMVDESDDADDWRHCFEVVLTEGQLSGWCAALEEVGFKQVYSFLNSNSGNECHVFLYESNRP